jgi:tRNA(Ser,Leu) C12 N-acetylase TAN1
VSERPGPATPSWNLLATSLEGQRESLLYALRSLAKFRRGGFPNVLIAKVDEPRAFLERLQEAHDRVQAIRGGLGKAIPMERTVRFGGPETFIDDVAAAVEPLLDRIAGRTFFARVFRRGFRGMIDSTTAEGEIGARIVALLEARGEKPKVSFRDADVVVSIETLRDELGIALLDRALRAAHPFVRIR